MAYSDEVRLARAAQIELYEKSPEWAQTRSRVWASLGRRACEACGRTEAQGARLVVHHRSTEAYNASYAFPGREWVSWFAGLCSDCHRLCHDLEKGTPGLGLEAATDLVLQRAAPTSSRRRQAGSEIPTTIAGQASSEPECGAIPPPTPRLRPLDGPAIYRGNQDESRRAVCGPPLYRRPSSNGRQWLTASVSGHHDPERWTPPSS